LYRKGSNIVATIPKGVTSFDPATSPQRHEAAWLSSRDRQPASRLWSTSHRRLPAARSSPCQPTPYSAQTYCSSDSTNRLLPISLPTSAADVRCRHLPELPPRRHTAHSRPEHNLPSETRPTNCILTTCNDLHYALYTTFETLINIVYVFYCACHYVKSHSIPHIV